MMIQISLRHLFVAGGVLSLLGACQSGSDVSGTATESEMSSQVTRHPESGLRVIPLTVEVQDRALHFDVELAATETEQAKGLMFRTELGSSKGMLFPMDPPRKAAFWMRNTVIPLDMIFVAPDHTVLNIAANATPYDETPRASDGKVSAVLELAGGRAAELGIKPGDKVTW